MTVCPSCAEDHPPYVACRPIALARVQDARRRGVAIAAKKAPEPVKPTADAVAELERLREANRRRQKAWRDRQKERGQ